MNWEDYLTLAKEILDKSETSPTREACLRCATSRAYYSAFHKALDYLKDKKVNKEWGDLSGSHQKVINELYSVLSPKYRGPAASLSRLKDFRHHSDYEGVKFEKTTAKASIQLAENIILGLQ
jgi:uncharacterized protein (UPF0332 family)